MLSTSDQRIVEELFEEGILHEGRIDSLAKTLVLTDAQCSTHPISIDVETPPAFLIANFGGALLLIPEISLFEGSEETTVFIQRQIFLVAEKLETIVLVAYAPSLAMAEVDFSIAEVIWNLVKAYKQLSTRLSRVSSARHLGTFMFLCVQFSDGREYTFQIESVKFSAWYRDYEQTILDRDDSEEFSDDGDAAFATRTVRSLQHLPKRHKPS